MNFFRRWGPVIIVMTVLALILAVSCSAPAQAAERPTRFVTKVFDTDTMKTRVTFNVHGKGPNAVVRCFRVRTGYGHSRVINAWVDGKRVINRRVPANSYSGCIGNFRASQSVVKVRVVEDIWGPFNIHKTHYMWAW